MTANLAVGGAIAWMRPSRVRVASPTAMSGTVNAASAGPLMLPSTNAAKTANVRPAVVSTTSLMNCVASSTSSRKWVIACPAELTGAPASDPPLAN